MYKKEVKPEGVKTIIHDLWELLDDGQKALLNSNISLRNYKKNEVV